MFSTLDLAAHTNRLRYFDTRLKLIFAMSTLLISVISTSPLPPLMALFTMTFLVLFKAKIKPGTYLFLMAPPLFFGFTGMFLMSFFFGYNGNPIYSFEILSHVFTIQKEGVNMGLLVTSRTLAGSSCLLFLALTTPMTELFNGLKWFRLPDVIIELSMLIYRYIFVLLDEAERMFLAVRLRGEGGFRERIEIFSMLTGTLFIRALNRGEKLFIAMNSRCYEGDTGSIAYQEKNNSINISALVAIMAFESLFAYITILTRNMLII